MARRKVVAATLTEHGFDWIHIGLCSGPVQVWEVAARPHETEVLYVFRIREARAAELRMMDIAAKRTASCASEDIHRTLQSVGSELAW